jgi:hypothetical protein
LLIERRNLMKEVVQSELLMPLAQGPVEMAVHDFVVVVLPSPAVLAVPTSLAQVDPVFAGMAALVSVDLDW